jgi:hypothetical protein
MERPILGKGFRNTRLTNLVKDQEEEEALTS